MNDCNIKEVELDLLDMINEFRTFPSQFVKDLENMLSNFSGKTYKDLKNKTNEITYEGKIAVEEAIGFLKVDIYLFNIIWNANLINKFDFIY